MKKICIIGWYGTETLGDRAILDGILQILEHTYKPFTAYIGSLYSFFTERTILEDGDVYVNTAPHANICVFDVKSKLLLKKHIVDSDLVIMGGGPIMDLNDLYIIRFGFSLAKKKRIPTCLMGCGLGPLNNRRFINVAREILELTDLGIFRDENSKTRAEEMCKDKKFYHCADPAIISILTYKSKYPRRVESETEDEVIINLREPTAQYGKNVGLNNDTIVMLLNRLGDRFGKVCLIPNHSFFVGGDDRVYMNRIMDTIDRTNITVLNNPPTLYQLYDRVTNARGCIGMRYHTVVIHTILSGNNYILDYTDPMKGKNIGFLNEMGNPEFYKKRYYNCTTNEQLKIDNCLDLIESDERYDYKYKENPCKAYCDLLKGTLHAYIK